MPEGDGWSEQQEVRGFRRVGVIDSNAQRTGRSPQQGWVARCVSGRHQQESLRVQRETSDLPEKVPLEVVVDREDVGQEPADGQLLGRERFHQLDDGQRVSAGFVDDPADRTFVQQRRA